MQLVNHLWVLFVLCLFLTQVNPKIKVKSPAPITGDPVSIEDKAYLAHFLKDKFSHILCKVLVVLQFFPISNFNLEPVCVRLGV